MSRSSNRRRKLKLIAIFGRWCHICGKPIGKRSVVSVDHIIPKSEGGTNDIENLRPAHRGCNSKRGNTPWPNPVPLPVSTLNGNGSSSAPTVGAPAIATAMSTGAWVQPTTKIVPVIRLDQGAGASP